jgi:transcriptional regulator with XRE-family HTH domain
MISTPDLSFLRDYRRANKITITKVCKASGMNKDTITRIENNKPVNFCTVVKYADALGFEMRFLLKQM